MKKIGTTEQGNILLEASEDEYLMLCHLASSLEGKTLDEVQFSRRIPGMMPDYYGVFGAIEAFALAHFKINDMVSLIGSFKDAVNEGWLDKINE